MKPILLVLILLHSTIIWGQPFPAPGYSDLTQTVLNRYGNDLELMAERRMDGVLVRLFLAKSAKTAIASGAFLVPDPAFDQEGLNSFIFKSFESSIAYYKTLSPGSEVRELNLVIVDQGGDKGTISEVPVHSRAIELHLVRWHKYYLNNGESYVALSSIHEFGHVVNYMYSPREGKLHRELTGVLLECANLVRLYGTDHFMKNYLGRFTTKISDPTQVLTSTYTNMNVVRSLVYVLFKNIYDGTYDGSLSAKELTERLAIIYQKNSLDGAEGLDDSFEKVGLRDQNGGPLTFATLQRATETFLRN